MPKTFIEVVNETLLAIGEIRVPTTQKSSTSVKCAKCVRDAWDDVQTSADWSWLKAQITSINWTLDKVTFNPPIQRISAVYSKYGEVNFPVRFTENRIYDQRPKYAWTADECIPLLYTIKGNDEIYVNPYPDTTQRQEKVLFDVIKYIVPPVLDTDQFEIPDMYLPLVLKRAKYLMYVEHVADDRMAMITLQDYEKTLTILRARQMRVPTTGYNMFRGLRRYDH